MGILNNKKWADIPDTWSSAEIINWLRKIAYINVKKIRGGAAADNNILRSFHKEFASIIEKQISLYNPDIYHLWIYLRIN